MMKASICGLVLAGVSVLCVAAPAQPTNPCANKKGSALTACLKANPPKNAGTASAANAQQGKSGAQAAAQTKMQGAVVQKSAADKAKADKLHSLTRTVK